MSAFIKQIRKIAANLKKSISLKLLVVQLVLRVAMTSTADKNIWCVARHIQKFDKRRIERFILAKNSSRMFRLQLLPFSARIKNLNV